MAEKIQDGQKTLVAFVVGLLIGGMLVWAFSGPTVAAPVASEDTKKEVIDESDEESSTLDVTDTEEEATKPAQLPVGKGSVVVNDQPASLSVEMESATYPISEGWIGVREYNNDQLGYILGVVRFSESQGLVPSAIELQRSTSAGNRYAIVIFTEDGDLNFNLASDVQVDNIFDTFVAQ